MCIMCYGKWPKNGWQIRLKKQRMWHSKHVDVCIQQCHFVEVSQHMRFDEWFLLMHKIDT